MKTAIFLALSALALVVALSTCAASEVDWSLTTTTAQSKPADWSGCACSVTGACECVGGCNCKAAHVSTTDAVQWTPKAAGGPAFVEWDNGWWQAPNGSWWHAKHGTRPAGYFNRQDDCQPTAYYQTYQTYQTGGQFYAPFGGMIQGCSSGG
jgi:hypothetical protein